MTRPPTLALAIQFASKADLPARPDLRRWARAALLQDAEVALRVVDEAEGRQLNRDFRGKDSATNVLTFAYGAASEATPRPPLPQAGEHPEGHKGRGEGGHGTPLCGDIVLCAPVVAREAREQGKPLADHYAHMVVHAMLHLQGYDHGDALTAAAMEAVESFIMKKLGYSDPYHDRRQ